MQLCSICGSRIKLEEIRSKIFCKKCLDKVRICSECKNIMTLRDTLKNYYSSSWCKSCDDKEGRAHDFLNM